MFKNIFRKNIPNQSNNPIKEVFSDLSLNQKMSIINLLMTIAICDGEQGNRKKELDFLNENVEILGVGKSSMEYFQQTGHERIIEDLSSLSEFQKDFLITLAWDMINCDGKPNQTELEVTEAYFDKIGIEAERFIATIEKAKYFL